MGLTLFDLGWVPHLKLLKGAAKGRIRGETKAKKKKRQTNSREKKVANGSSVINYRQAR